MKKAAKRRRLTDSESPEVEALLKSVNARLDKASDAWVKHMAEVINDFAAQMEKDPTYGTDPDNPPDEEEAPPVRPQPPRRRRTAPALSPAKRKRRK